MGDFWSNLVNTRPNEQPPPRTSQNLPWMLQPLAETPQRQPDRLEELEPGAVPGSSPEDAARESLAKTQWARDTNGRCPNPSCRSDNYMATSGTGHARCFDCGYPAPRQTGSDATIQGEQTGPVQASRQLAEARTNNFSPQRIIAAPHRKS